MDASKATKALKEEKFRVDKEKAKGLPGETDAFITVLGASESAISTFMRTCSGKDAVGIGHGLMKVIFEYNGLKVHLINVPGFGDRTPSDTDPLVLIASYFAATYKFHIELNGIIYISTEWMFDVATNNVNLFFKIIGDEASSKVVLATSEWNMIGASRSDNNLHPHRVEGGSRDPYLRERFCRPFMEKGSKVCRLDGNKEAAFHILDVLLPGGEREGQVLQIQRELVDDMISLDETEAGHQLLKEIREKSQEAGPEDGRKELRVGFERLVRQKWGVNASLFRRLEMDRMKKAAVIDELSSKLRVRGAQMQPKENYRTAEPPHTGKARSRLGAHLPGIPRLEHEIEKAQKYVAKKEARMREIRGLMLDVLSDTASNPPRAYTQSETPREPSGVTSRQTHLRRNPSNTSDEAKDIDKFKSTIARNETRRVSQGTEDAPRSDVRRVRTRRPRVNLRALEEERQEFREELYQSSLLAFEQDTDPGMARNPVLQRRSADVEDVDTLCKQYQIPIGDRKGLQDLLSHTLTSIDKKTLTFSAWLFYQSYLLRNAILMEPGSNSRTRVVNLIRIKIDDVREVVDRLGSFVTVLQDHISERTVPHSVSTLTRLSDEVHLLYRKIFERLGLEDLLSDHRHGHDLGTELETRLSSRSLGGSPYFVDMLAQWWRATRALDVGVVAYERSHVSNSKQTFRIDLASKLPQLGVFKLQETHQGPRHSKSLRYVSRGLNCLDGFFERHPVWVLAVGEVSNDLYLAADIETFADAWGPVWKAVDQSRPELIAKYNVNGGSIVPWPSNPDIHPKLRSNERLCHWKSNDEYFFQRDDISANVDSSSSSSDSEETKQTKEDSIQATGFSGNEILVIGAGQDAPLEWHDCNCSLYAIRRHLENIGNIERILAEDGYQYIESRQDLAFVGGHGAQLGVGRTVKYREAKSLKVGLLEQWQNEPHLCDPREFEDLWGIFVSLCTMNAKRVRLVELFAEPSVLRMLKHFRWSESYQRRKFLDAIRSGGPFALGDLWEDYPRWRKKLGNAIYLCLQILFKTGYEEHLDEFHMLWYPRGCRGVRRVTLKPSDYRWTKLLKDTTYSVTAAVITEDSLGTGPCTGRSIRRFRSPSILETAICVNTNITPREKLHRSRDIHDKYSKMPRDYDGRWRRVWNVSDIRAGEKFYMRSQQRLETICQLNSRHLLLKMDTVWRAELPKLIGMKKKGKWEGHREYTDVELDGDGDRPIPVHITS